MNNAPFGPLGILGDEGGVAEVGAQLLARPNGVTDADGIDHTSWAFQWTRDGDPITGATGPLYTVTSEDMGADVGLRGSYMDRAGNHEEVEAKPVRVPDPVSDAIAALYFLIFDREPDALGRRFYVGLYRNGVKLSFLVADMERNKAAGAK